MKYQITASAAFKRALKKTVGKNKTLAEKIALTISAMQENPFTPSLKTHKLQGKLKDAYAASAGYDLRIIFDLSKIDGQNCIVLLSVGTHDEVY